MTALSANMARRVLTHLKVKPSAPDFRLLNRLLSAYVQSVPWESASRIAKRARVQDRGACARWPDEFWDDALTLGCGGTCFESNYAFFALLQSLGYAGYLTINDMGDAIGCHTAIVIEIAGRPRLVDVGFPVPVALRLDPECVTRTNTAFHTYVVRPAGDARFDIERTVHPKRNMFTLHNRPVADADYVSATIRDYGSDGLFLDRVVINKIIDGRMWRFTSESPAPHFSAFSRNGYFEEPIAENSVVATVAHRFQIDERVLHQAYAALKYQID